MNEAPKPGTTWTPTKNPAATFSRRVLVVTPSRHGRQYDQVQFRRVLADGTLGVVGESYMTSWHAWVRRHDVVQADAHPGTIDVTADGPVDGMGEPRADGSYVQLSISHKDGSRHNFRISKGAAEVLVVEIRAALGVG